MEIRDELYVRGSWLVIGNVAPFALALPLPAPTLGKGKGREGKGRDHRLWPAFGGGDCAHCPSCAENAPWETWGEGRERVLVAV